MKRILTTRQIEKRLQIPDGSLGNMAFKVVDYSPVKGCEACAHNDDPQKRHQVTDAEYHSDPSFIPEVDDNYIMDPQQARKVLIALMLGVPMQAFGPTGSGKTTFFEQLSARLGREFRVIQCDEKITTKNLLGKQEVVVDETTGQSKTAFALGCVPLYIQHPGAVVLLDEYDDLGPGVGFCLQSLLHQNHPVLRIVELDEGGIFYPAEDLLIAATSNTVNGVDETGEYERVMQDKSQVDRFLCKIPFKAPDERAILAKRFGVANGGNLTDGVIDCLVAFTDKFRESPTLGKVYYLSTRRVIFMADVLSLTGDAGYALQYALLDELPAIQQQEAQLLATHQNLVSPTKRG